MEHFGHLGMSGFLWIQVLQFTNVMTWILRSGMRLEDRFLEHLGWAKIPLTLRPFGNETWKKPGFSGPFNGKKHP